MKSDVTEWALVTAFLALAAAGAVAIFGDEIRAGLGVGAAARRPAREAPGSAVQAPAPAAPAPRP